MMNASNLLEALRQDVPDQRAIAEHLVNLTKELKNTTAATSATERSGSPTSAVAPRNEISTETGDDDVPDAQDPEDDSPEQEEELEERTQEIDQEEQHPTEEEMQSEYGAPDPPDNLDDMEAKPASNLESDTSVLLELVRGFRSEMLRVESTLRATMFRAVRYLVRTGEDADLIRKQRFGLFIALALARAPYNLWERMQALKLVRQIMTVDASKVPREVVRTIVAVSAHKEDNFRRVCLETLRDLAIADSRVVAHANGFRVLLAAANDPETQDLADSLVNTFITVIEDPSTRKYIRPHLELHHLLSGFTDLDIPPGPERVQCWKATRKALVVVMRSWAGLHLLASDPRGLVSLMRLLRDPSASLVDDPGLQDNILDTIMEVCEPLSGICRPGSSSDAGVRQRDFTLAERVPQFSTSAGGSAAVPKKRAASGVRTGKKEEPHDMLLNYATILCAAFVHCGLIPSLTTLCITAASEGLRAKATRLLVDVLQLCAMLLSQNQCTRLLSMPGLVQIAAECQVGYMAAGKGGAQSNHLVRSRASRASDLIRLLHQILGAGAGGALPLQLNRPMHPIRPPSQTIGWFMQKVGDGRRSMGVGYMGGGNGWEYAGTLQQMRKELRLDIESTVEKSTMENQMNKSKVLTTKDWTKWEWEVIDDIMQDVLSHPPRLVDALRTKWIKRVSGFYRFVGAGNIGSSTDRGGGGGLHNICWDADNIRHIACAGRMYALLLQHSDGLHFLQTDARGAILQEIVKELQALVSRRWSSGSGSGRFTGPLKVFDMEACQQRLSGGYLTLLFSVAGGTESGRQFLSNMGLWATLESMGSQPELDYMSRLILTRLDLHCNKFIVRDLLRSWMKSGSSNLRLFAVNLMRSVLRHTMATHRDTGNSVATSQVEAAATDEDSVLEVWCIETLAAQLNGSESTIARAALSVLEEAAKEERCVRILVLARPDLINVPGGNNLLMRFLSISEGIQYLSEMGWLERMMHDWKHEYLMADYDKKLYTTWKVRLGDTCDGSWDGNELQLLLGLPWNIEVVLSRDSAPAAGLQLRVDTWVDVSPTEARQSPPAGVANSLGVTTMVVRGLLVDGGGKATCHPLEANLTLHARLCLGSCAVDRWGDVHTLPLADIQPATFRRTRIGRPSRSQWSPQHGRGDHGTYGSNAMYRGGQVIQDFGQGRDMSEDLSEMDNHLLWSSCRPHQRMAASRPPANPGEERKRGGSRRGRSRIRPISPVSKTLHDDERASDVGSGFHSSREPSAASEVERALGESTRIFKGHTDNDQVVHVPGETARWILTNQPEHEDAITMQVVENSRLRYLKGVEFTISFKDSGPSCIPLPPHLYGELSKTERGCELLRQNGDLKSLLHAARTASFPAKQRRAALWALGHICRWPNGLVLVEGLQGNFISTLLNLCTSESHFSVWRTAFCVVSLVARTTRGRASIRSAGWESSRDPSINIFLPSDPAVLFQDQQADVLQQVEKLSSHISRKDAMRKLNRMRKDKSMKEAFTNSIPIFILVHQLLADYSFTLPLRRYLFDSLFNDLAPRAEDWEPYVIQ